MLIKRNIRRILQNIPDKNTKNALEEIILILEELDGEKTHLATKDDIKQVKDGIKDDIKQVIEMMNARFEAMEKSNAARFEAVNQRFEAIDKRFEAIEKANTARFEAINQRFESLEKRLSFIQWLIGGGVLLVALKLFFPHIFPQ